MDVLDFSRVISAFFIVLAAMGVLAFLAKRAGYGKGGAMQSRRRLSLIETLPLDARRRAAIIRCDGREHLIILGPTGETVVEANLPAVETPAVEEAHAAPNFAETFSRIESFARERNPFSKNKKADAA